MLKIPVPQTFDVELPANKLYFLEIFNRNTPLPPSSNNVGLYLLTHKDFTNIISMKMYNPFKTDSEVTCLCVVLGG